MKLRSTLVTAIAAVVALALAPAAMAKGTAYVVGMTNLVATHTVGANGELALQGTTATGNTPRSGAISPDARHLYIANFGGANISAFTIGSGGALSPVTGSPFPAGTQPEGLVASADGQFVYAANQGGNSISGYTRDSSSGTLTPVPGSPFAITNPMELAMSPDGSRLFATTDTGVQSFNVGPAGAILPNGGVIAAGTNPKGIAITPDARFLYVANTGSANLTGFSIDANGALTSLGNTPVGNVPQTVAIPQAGGFVYVANSGTDNVSGFSIGADGSLSPVSGQPFAASNDPYGLDVAPNSRVYTSTFNGAGASQSNVYTLGTAGQLAQIDGSPFPGGVNGAEFQSIAITPNQGPSAVFTAVSEGAGQEALFNATSSSDSDGGTVARYDWDFGDGTTLPNGGPTPSHVYAEQGDYQVTLTVTDDEGCSNQPIFTGQTADCNPNTTTGARVTQTLQVGPGTGPNLKLKGKKQELAKKVTVTAKTADETDAVAKGKLKIEPKGKSKKTLDLKKAKKSLDAGEKTKLKPKLSKKAYKQAKKALRNGGKVSAKVKVKVTDDDADTDKDSVKVKLKKP